MHAELFWNKYTATIKYICVKLGLLEKNSARVQTDSGGSIKTDKQRKFN